MDIDKRLIGAEFAISDNILIRYKKDYGFWIHMKIKGNWYSCLRNCKINPFAIGFKTQYGFGFEDIKTQLFQSFDEAINSDILIDFNSCNNPKSDSSTSSLNICEYSIDKSISLSI